ncbi:MAG: hypothetical protein RLZZ573_2226, partial [Pseudomonadota bacterium]
MTGSPRPPLKPLHAALQALLAYAQPLQALESVAT